MLLEEGVLRLDRLKSYNLDKTIATNPRAARPTALLDCWLKEVLV